MTDHGLQTNITKTVRFVLHRDGTILIKSPRLHSFYDYDFHYRFKQLKWFASYPY
jgi:hypothetical protein